jgi:hypothetical protein
MKRTLLILLGGLILGGATFCAFYAAEQRAARSLQTDDQPELAWLKHEFRLGDAEFERISRLHETYLPHCMEMCERIAAKQAELDQLLGQSDRMTAEIERVMEESATLRLRCQKMMLQHFYEVSQAMPPDQGKRYLDWVVGRTFAADFGMPAR